MFTQLRGYDEDCHGSGYQDVDFSRRCAAAAKTGLVAAPHKFHGVHNVTLTDSHAIIGYPIANVDLELDELRQDADINQLRDTLLRVEQRVARLERLARLLRRR